MSKSSCAAAESTAGAILRMARVSGRRENVYREWC